MPKADKEKSGSSYALWGTIITALIGLIGTALTLYFQNVYPLKIAARSTQTAEAHLTWQATSFTATLTYVPPTDTLIPPTPVSPTAAPVTEMIASLTPIFTPTSTFTPTPLPPTFTPTLAVVGVKYCVDTQYLNVRTGPGMEFPAVGLLDNFDCLSFDGRVEGSLWVRVSAGQSEYLNFGGMWVFGLYLRPQDFERLPVVTPPPLPPTPYISPTPVG